MAAPGLNLTRSAATVDSSGVVRIGVGDEPSENNPLLLVGRRDSVDSFDDIPEVLIASIARILNR